MRFDGENEILVYCAADPVKRHQYSPFFLLHKLYEAKPTRTRANFFRPPSRTPVIRAMFGECLRGELFAGNFLTNLPTITGKLKNNSA